MQFEGLAKQVCERVTARQVILSQGVGLYILLLRSLEAMGDPAAVGSLIQNIVYAAAAPLLVLFAAIAADIQVERGAGPFRSYLSYLLLAALLSAALRLGAREISVALGWLPSLGSHLWPYIVRLLDVALDVSFTGGAFMLAFHNRRQATRVLEAVRAADLQRLLIERRLLESRLATAEAQIDPDELFASLARIRNLLVVRSPHADADMDSLIQGLRNRLQEAK